MSKASHSIAQSLRRFLLALALLPGLAGALTAQAIDPDEVLAVVGSSRITAGEVDRILAGRRDFLRDLPLEDRRARMLDTLVAEYLVDYFYGRDLSRLSPAVLDSLSDARRQVLFQLFAQSEFRPPEISDAEVRAFVDANRDSFGDRASYRYLDLRMNGGSTVARQSALRQVEALDLASDTLLAEVNDLVAALNGAGLATTVNTIWTTSEVIPADTLAILRPMAADGRRLDSSDDGTTTRVIVLLGATPVPVDPTALRPQIEARLMQQAFETHRAALVAQLSQSVLDARAAAQSDAPPLAVQPPPQGTVVWSPSPVLPREIRLAGLFATGFLGALAGYAILTWMRMVADQHRRIGHQGYAIPLLKKRGVAMTIGGLLGLGVIAAFGFGVWVSSDVFGERATLVLLAGAAVLAGAVAFVWHSRSARSHAAALEQYSEMYSDPDMAESAATLAQSSIWRLVAAIALVLGFAVALAVLLDMPAGLR